MSEVSPFPIHTLVKYQGMIGHIAFYMPPTRDFINYYEGCITIALPPSYVRLVVYPHQYSLITPITFMNKTVSLTESEIDVIIQSLYYMKDTLKGMTDIDDDKKDVLSSCYRKLVNA
jgi:hypothetical protein